MSVLRAVVNGANHVTGIEINPAIATEVMRGRYGDFSHRLYSRPDVTIEVEDGHPSSATASSGTTCCR